MTQPARPRITVDIEEARARLVSVQRFPSRPIQRHRWAWLFVALVLALAAGGFAGWVLAGMQH